MKCGNCGSDTELVGGKIWKCGGCGSMSETIDTNPNRARAYSLGVESVTEPTTPEDGTEERCPVCGHTLLGIWYGGVLQVRHQGREWIIAGGTIGVRCSTRCGYTLSIDTSTYEVNIVSSFNDVINKVANATDSAKDLASAHGVLLSDVEGTGKGGKIIKPNVEAYIERMDDNREADEGDSKPQSRTR